jgi:hypothetical protein
MLQFKTYSLTAAFFLCNCPVVKVADVMKPDRDQITRTKACGWATLLHRAL